jgi:hypothetical protein
MADIGSIFFKKDHLKVDIKENTIENTVHLNSSEDQLKNLRTLITTAANPDKHTAKIT